MGLVQSQDLPMGLTRVTGAGDVTALQRGLLPQVLLKYVEAVEAIFFAEVMAEVARPLIKIHRGGKRTQELLAGRVVGRRDERQQLLHRGIAVSYNLAAFRVSQNIGGDAHTLALAQAFIADEEEGVISPDRAAHSSAEVIALERAIACGLLLKKLRASNASLRRKSKTSP